MYDEANIQSECEESEKLSQTSEIYDQTRNILQEAQQSQYYKASRAHKKLYGCREGIAIRMYVL